MYKKWLGHAKDEFQNYEALKQELREIEQNIIFGHGSNDTPVQSDVSSATERKAIRLATNERREHLQRAIAAIEYATQATERMEESRARLNILDAAYIKRTKTVEGAAMDNFMSEDTACKRAQETYKIFARKMGWI